MAQRLHEGFGGCFEETGLLDDLTKILDYTNEMLIIVDGYRLHPVLARMFVLENLDRAEDFASSHGRYVGESTMKALCDKLKDLLEEVDVDD